MRKHLLRVERPVVEFGPLIAAVRHEGGRVGWLELPSSPAAAPASLEAAASLGVLRAVAVGGGRAVSVKPMRGEPVPSDVLREHFHGCCLVLVAGGVDAPLLAPRNEGWAILAAGSEKHWSTERLVAALAKPRPWD